MGIFEALRNSGIEKVNGNTAVLHKDGVDIDISISSISNVTNVCAKTKINYDDDFHEEMIHHVIALNNGMVFPLGTYWLNEDKELELILNMIVEGNPTRKRLEEVISKLASSVLSSASYLETRGNDHE